MVKTLINENEIYAVIVTYNPDIDNVKTLIEELKRQNVLSIIVDNGTLSESNKRLLTGITNLVNLESNMGIAKAQNEGIALAETFGANYILFFDQDSQIKSNFVENLINDFKKLEEKKCRIGTIGPVFVDSRYKFFYKQIRLNKFGIRKKINPEHLNEPFEATLIISSGSLVPIDVIRDVGVMDENLFIDYVDTEWCLRAISKGYGVYVSTSARMEHAIGDKMINFFGYHVPVHSPIRRYYRIRNAIIFSKMNHIPIIVKVRDNIMNCIHQTILVITQKDKMKNISILFKAIRDGLSGKGGKCNF